MAIGQSLQPLGESTPVLDPEIRQVAFQRSVCLGGVEQQLWTLQLQGEDISYPHDSFYEMIVLVYPEARSGDLPAHLEFCADPAACQ